MSTCSTLRAGVCPLPLWRTVNAQESLEYALARLPAHLIE
jgi:hypothetical protein